MHSTSRRGRNSTWPVSWAASRVKKIAAAAVGSAAVLGTRLTKNGQIAGYRDIRNHADFLPAGNPCFFTPPADIPRIRPYTLPRVMDALLKNRGR